MVLSCVDRCTVRIAISDLACAKFSLIFCNVWSRYDEGVAEGASYFACHIAELERACNNRSNMGCKFLICRTTHVNTFN